MLEHDEVLALYVGLSVSLLLTFLLFVPERERERGEDRGEGKEGCGLPDVGVLAAGGGAAVNPRPGRLNPPSVVREPPPVPGQVVQLPDRRHSSALIQCSI